MCLYAELHRGPRADYSPAPDGYRSLTRKGAGTSLTPGHFFWAWADRSRGDAGHGR
jgi:hypothetical protein